MHHAVIDIHCTFLPQWTTARRDPARGYLVVRTKDIEATHREGRVAVLHPVSVRETFWNRVTKDLGATGVILAARQTRGTFLA